MNRKKIIETLGVGSSSGLGFVCMHARRVVSRTRFRNELTEVEIDR